MIAHEAFSLKLLTKILEGFSVFSGRWNEKRLSELVYER